ncbi:MAG: C40 family peptidase [Robiginitomaculum sp.]|nr:C40 family peptidase [Robiginitomaculum sp.]MBL4757597.1 C40 family peptidase [Hyphomicrobiales bacterium]
MSQQFDPRITPARSDLAAEHLRGIVTAEKFVSGNTLSVITEMSDLLAQPKLDQSLQSQLLFGEQFVCLESKDGWAWGQSVRDGYVGYVRASALQEQTAIPDHWISSLRTPVFSQANLKSPIVGYLHRNSQIHISKTSDDYCHVGMGWVAKCDIQAINSPAEDWVEVAKTYLHSPYVWGGRSSFGLDCSALIQNSLQAAGISCPRDSDMQEEQLGKPVRTSDFTRGDLLFWKGHVGVMVCRDNFLHANAASMKTVIEPVSEAINRIEKTAGPITSIRRFS